MMEIEISDTKIKINSKEALDILLIKTQTIISALGFEAVALEQSQNPGGRTYTLYIDFLSNATATLETEKRIGINDCIAVNDAVSELFETTNLIDGTYNLEVSSPGIERPLKNPADYLRFKGRKARIHTFRPLTTVELENNKHWEKNQKQKNYIGILEGMNAGETKVKMKIDGELVHLPLELISKAHLEFMEA